jgi:hypothetical protein
MSRGALIFARDSGDIKYSDLAQWSAARIQRHLGVPTTVINDTSQQNGVRSLGSVTVPWYNLGRHQAFDLSPYDETLLLDADYIVASDQLSVLFGSGHDMLCMTKTYDVTGRKKHLDIDCFGRHRMPMAWATVMYFRHSKSAKLIFDMIEMIESNWQHYRDIYGISEKRFRNDYALAIASNTVNGHTGTWPSIPWNMAMADPDCDIYQINDDDFVIRFVNADQTSRRVSVRGQDLHFMNKLALGAMIAD